VLPDTSFGGDDVGTVVASSAAACCAVCLANKRTKECTQWAWHTQAKGS
jgi:hypothetical protein